MSIRVKLAFTLLTLTAASSAAAVRAATITPGLAKRALEQALIAWREDPNMPVDLRLENIGSCRINGEDNTATTQAIDTVTKIRYESEDPAEAPVIVTNHAYSYIIRVNTSCDWGRIDIWKIMVHEVGHLILGGEYHSQDRHSIMFKVVYAGEGQIITDTDWLFSRRRNQ